MSPENSQRRLVSMRGIVKRFAGVTVVDGVDLDLFAGQVHVLAGENGAGKSTLMKILGGIHRADDGTIEIDDVELEPGLRAATEAGVALVHQELLIAPNLSVADNLAMGREYRSRLGHLDRRATLAGAREQLDRVGARFSPSVKAEELSTGEQQLVEIARALSHEPRVLILDEPTASLSAREVENLFRIVRELRAAGTAIVYITHRMEEIEQLADVVTILRDGALVETLPISAAPPAAIVSRMVGRPIESLFSASKAEPGQTMLEARDISDGVGIGPLSLTARAGEVVGIAGLVGSGRSETARLIFGADRLASGQVVVDGSIIARPSPANSARHGLALVPESRKSQGLVLSQSVANNIVHANLRAVSWGGVIKQGRIRKAAEREKARFGIKASSFGQEVGELSGGNQQKVLLAKWLQTEPKVLILDEPTRGVDIGAKADIYKMISDCAEAGMAIVVISSELPELLGISDRVLVMREGQIVAELPNEDLTEETVMEFAFGITVMEQTSGPRAQEVQS